jgi:hypothetical protein
MKRTMILLALVAVVAFGAFAQSTNASHNVTLNVSAVYKISVSAGPSFSIGSADFTAGNSTVTKTDAASTYSYTTNTTSSTITAALDQAMPSGLALSVNLGDGLVALSTTAATVKAFSARGAAQNQAITYSLTADTDSDAGTYTRQVTFTFSN